MQQVAPQIVETTDLDVFIHVRMVISIIVSLSIGRLLNGLAGFVQHPSRKRVDLVHFLWVVFTLLFIIQFWWWEFHLSTVDWDFLKFSFVIFYASTLYFLCALLFPDTLNEYSGYGDYFMSRRLWFFGIFLLFIVMDFFDTLLKGVKHLNVLGEEYYIRGVVFIIFSFIAMRTQNRMVHMLFALFAIVYEFHWVFRRYGELE